MAFNDPISAMSRGWSQLARPAGTQHDVRLGNSSLTGARVAADTWVGAASQINIHGVFSGTTLSCKFGFALAAAVVNDERCHHLFGYFGKYELTAEQSIHYDEDDG